MDTRNFKDGNNPFAPEGYDDSYTEEIIDPASSSASYKAMHAMVDSFLYQVESLQREKELKAKRTARKEKK